MSLEESLAQILEAVEIAKENGLPENIVLGWLMLEVSANAVAIELIRGYGDRFFKFLKDVTEITPLPLTDEQVEFYKKRFEEVKEYEKMGEEIISERTGNIPANIEEVENDVNK